MSKLRILVHLFSLLLLAGPLSAQIVGGQLETKWRNDGQQDHAQLGIAVSGAGDIDVDGFPDVIVGKWGSAFVYSGRDGSLIWQSTGPESNDMFGSSVSGGQDFDGDGIDDVIIGAQQSGPRATGAIYVYSGATGILIWQLVGEREYDRFGCSVSSVGDIDGDGLADVIVGARYGKGTGSGGTGSATVLSGKDGSLIWRFTGEVGFDQFGSSVSGAGYIDGDGIPDLVVGAPKADSGGLSSAGLAYVYSGATGTLIWKFAGDSSFDNLGNSVSGAGDVNGDGIDDVIVGAPRTDPESRSNAGSAYVYSGATGALLWRFDGEKDSDSLGVVSGAGDIDGDGFEDVVVGAPDAHRENRLYTGSAYVLSGRTGALIWQINGSASEGRLGSSASAAGDVDGDGFLEVIVGAPTADPNGPRSGSAYVYGLDSYIEATGNEISIAAGGRVDYQMDFPITAAGYQYKVLASSSGTGPMRYGTQIPLTADSLVRRTWHGGYKGMAKGNLHGTLDSDGKASAFLRINPDTWTTLIGLDFHIAAIAMTAGGRPEFSSVAVPLTIKP